MPRSSNQKQFTSENADKNTSNEEVCQCCLSKKDLRSITKPYLYYGKYEVYSQMLTTCFSELCIEDGVICPDCIRRLRSALDFKKCVESARSHFQTQSSQINLNKENNIIIEEQDEDVSRDNVECFDETQNVLENPVARTSNFRVETNSESSEDEFFKHFNSPIQDSQQVFVDKYDKFAIGEQRTLPYCLDNTDRKCEICSKEFSFYGELLNHMPEHYPNHICEVCGKICTTRKSLMFHIKTHTEDRLQCDMCEKSFKNKSNLNAHVKVQHKGEKILYKCPICNEKLETYNARVKHMSLVHDREDKLYKCSQCSCKYRLGSHLRAHMRRVHLQEKNYKCQICEASFFSRKSLENHSLKHTGEKSFTCSICNKSFVRKETLKQHTVRSHSTDLQNFDLQSKI